MRVRPGVGYRVEKNRGPRGGLGERKEKPCFDFSSLSGCENIFPLANHGVLFVLFASRGMPFRCGLIRWTPKHSCSDASSPTDGSHYPTSHTP